MSIELDALCPKCSSLAMKLSAESAIHDVSLIDLVATCGDCGLVLNSFVSIDDMCELDQGEA